MHSVETSPILAQPENAIREMEWFEKLVAEQIKEKDDEIELLKIENNYLKKIDKKNDEIIKIAQEIIKKLSEDTNVNK